jgi:hypothetical protein
MAKRYLIYVRMTSLPPCPNTNNACRANSDFDQLKNGERAALAAARSIRRRSLRCCSDWVFHQRSKWLNHGFVHFWAAELGQEGADLNDGAKVDADKLALAARLRSETTLTIQQLADRLHMGSRKSVGPKLHSWNRTTE